MKLPTNLVGAAATASTVFLNFWPWLLAAFLLGAGVAGYGGFKVAKVFYRGEALEAKLQLSKFQGELASNAAAGQKQAREDLEKAHADIDAWRQGIEARIDSGFAGVTRQLTGDIKTLRESINAPIYDCLRVPYPADGLRLLSRPAGSVPAGDHPDPGAAAPAGRVP